MICETGGGRHVLPALRVAAEGGQAAHAHDGGRESADAVGGAGIVQKAREQVAAPPHERERGDAQHEKDRERNAEGAVRLPGAAEGVGLAHELGERDGKARGRDGQERGVDVIGVGEVRAAALAEDVAQRDLEDRADDLDRDDAEREHGGAAEEGLLFFSSHRKALSRSERFQTGQKKFRKHGGRRLGGLVDLRAGERLRRTPAAMLASSVTPHDLHTAVGGDDGLGHGGHTDRVGRRARARRGPRRAFQTAGRGNTYKRPRAGGYSAPARSRGRWTEGAGCKRWSYRGSGCRIPQGWGRGRGPKSKSLM